MAVRATPPRPMPIAVRAPQAPAFSALSAPEKAVAGVKLAGEKAPGVLRRMWAHKGEVLEAVVAPYLHPLRSLSEANRMVAESAKEGLLEAGLTALKHHGGLLAAWALPVSIALVPFTGAATLVATAASLVGTVSLGASAVSLGKNVYDASQAATPEALDAQADQILADGLNLGTAAATTAVAHGVKHAVRFARGRYGPGRPLAGPEPARVEPAAMKAHRDQVLKAVGQLTDDEIRALELTPVKAGALRGNSVKMVVEDAAGNKYLFKPLEAGATTLETERFAMRLRRAAGEPTVAAVPQRVALPDGTVLEGYVKPFVKNQGNLKADPGAWTTAQRHQVLADHGWMEFLGNYDTKSDQSVRIGDTALNVDWDHALTDYVTNGPLTRHKAHNPAPPAQNLLYQAYVRGQVDLDFRPLFETIERIQQLPEAAVRQELAPFLGKAFADGRAFGPYRTPEALVQAVLGRQKGLKSEFNRFVGQLQRERAFHLGRSQELPSWGEYVGTVLQDTKMEALGDLVDTKAFGYGNQAVQAIRKLKVQAAR